MLRFMLPHSSDNAVTNSFELLSCAQRCFGFEGVAVIARSQDQLEFPWRFLRLKRLR